MQWRDDLNTSMDVFDRLVRPVLPRFVTGEIVRVEGSPEKIAELLDKRAGIDVLIDKGDFFCGLGSRIQIDSGVWNTFTIRCDRESGHLTELEKLRKAIENDAIRPNLTMQAYVEDGVLQSIAMARTKDIVEFIDNHDCPVRRSRDDKGWALFKVVYWRLMKEAGYRIKALDFRALNADKTA